MNFKKSLLLLLTVVLLFSCKQEELLEQNSSTANLTANSSKYDNSNLGIYKGIFTTLDASERGTIEVYILDNVPSRATLTLSSGATFVLQSNSLVSSRQDTALSFAAISESMESASFTFSVNADGTNIKITKTSFRNKDSHILMVKETSRGVALGVPGTYACTDCGTHPSLGTGPQTFNAVFVSDPQGEGSSTMETQFTLNGVVFTSPASDNSQDGGSCSDNGDFTTCDISGSTTIGANMMTWMGSHLYDNTPTSCSEMFGTWTHPGYGGISGTFVSDEQLCQPEIGDFRDDGVVFYIAPVPTDLNGDGILDIGLVCSVNNAPTTLAWGCSGADLSIPNVVVNPPSGDGAEIGDGMDNTNGILAECPTAPAASYTRSLGSEWFLPSALEYNEMYLNSAVVNITSIANGGVAMMPNAYWSSTEFNSIGAWIENFGLYQAQPKVNGMYVRAVKAFPPPPPAAIGDLRAGGVVFWVDPLDNTHGLVCALEDHPIRVGWGCVVTALPSVPNVTVGDPVGLGAEIGDGMTNTIGILNDCPSAPAALAARSLGPEWFLPSILALNEMYQNRATLEAVPGVSPFQDAQGIYWSSTEYEEDTAWVIIQSFGILSIANKDDESWIVRAVKAF